MSGKTDGRRQAADGKGKGARVAGKTGKIRFNIKRLLVSALVLVFCCYFVYTVIGQQVDLSRKNGEIRDLNAQVEAASRETDRLNEELESVNDPEYLERMAREKLGLVMPNERVYIDLSGGN